MKPKHLLAALLTVILSLAACRMFPQSGKPKYEPSELQKLRLQIKQKDAQMAQQNVQIANANFQQVMAVLNAEVKAVEKENKWPDTLQIDFNTMEFKPAPEKPAPAPAGKK